MRRIAYVVLLLGLTGAAHADGGRVRMQQTSGEFIVTLFTAPEPLTTGDADLSVLVQDRATQQILLDASTEIQLISPVGEMQTIPLTRGQASNKMLQAATAHLGRTGSWIATVRVRRGAEQTACSTGFDVAPNHSRRALVLTFLLLPLFAIALFTLHQCQRSRLYRGSTSSRA
jgi:hypothetical protein